MASEYQGRLMITRIGDPQIKEKKRIICDSVDKDLESVILTVFNQYSEESSGSLDQKFHKIQLFNERLFKVMPFLKYNNYEDYIINGSDDRMNDFWQMVRVPVKLSELTESRNLDCAAQAYALLLTIPEKGWHPYVRRQQVHEENFEEKSHVVLAKQFGKRMGVLDPTLGSCMVESQQRKFLLPNVHSFYAVHMPVNSIPYSPRSQYQN